MENLGNGLIYLFDSFHYGYLVLAPVFLIGRLFRKIIIRNESINFLSVINLLFGIGLCIELIVYVVELYIGYRGGSRYEFYVVGPSDQLFYITFGLMYLIGILFLFKRLRKSWVLTILMLILICSDRLLIILLQWFRDYIPSEWEVYYTQQLYLYIFKTLIFAALVFLVYLLLAKRKKLPHPSALIR